MTGVALPTMVESTRLRGVKVLERADSGEAPPFAKAAKSGAPEKPKARWCFRRQVLPLSRMSLGGGGSGGADFGEGVGEFAPGEWLGGVELDAALGHFAD